MSPQMPTLETTNVTLMDLVVLLANVHRGARSKHVGFEDADNTLEQLTRKLNKTVQVDLALVESAMWSCNLMNEQGTFWHPRGDSFDQFEKRISQNRYFDRHYNNFKKAGSK